MILNTKTRYAVMAMVELAAAKGETPITLAALARSQEIPQPYLEQIFVKLRRQGLVKSVRGPGGGYRLAKPREMITVSEIVEAVEESTKMTRCSGASAHGCTASTAKCATHDLWEGLSRQINQYLRGITLADMTRPRVIAKSA